MKELAESEVLKNIIFITYPRSGINYFAERFEQKTNLYLPRSHFYEKVNKEIDKILVKYTEQDWEVSRVQMNKLK